MHIHSLERNGDLLPPSTSISLTIIILTHLSEKIQLKRNHLSKPAEDCLHLLANNGANHWVSIF